MFHCGVYENECGRFITRNKEKLMTNVVLISDPNADVDDLMSFVTAAALADRGLLNLKAVVATTGEFAVRVRRAKFTKGALIALGHPKVAVAVGEEYELHDEKHDNFYCVVKNTQELEEQSVEIDCVAQNLLQKIADEAQDNSITLVINAQMSDVATFLDTVNASKIAKIVIMGGIAEGLSAKGNILPNATSYNNVVCISAANMVYEFAQEHDIPLVMVPKETVYQAQVGHDFYDKMTEYKNPVAGCIYDASKMFLENLWNSVKAGDFSHFDVRRFAKVFMGADYKLSQRELNGHDDFATVWAKVKYFNLYDAMAVIVAVDDLFAKYGHLEKVLENRKVWIAKIDEVESFRQLLYDLMAEKLQ